MESFSQPALVTGANRGLGRAIVGALLDRGVPKVYAAARVVSTAPRDERIVPLAVDLRDQRLIAASSELSNVVSLIIND